MPYSGTFTKSKIIDTVAEKIGTTLRQSIEVGRNSAGTYQTHTGICKAWVILNVNRSEKTPKETCKEKSQKEGCAFIKK